ncbi:hypothetical protein [Methanospirillum sp.]
MNWDYVIVGCACILIAGLVGADSVSSTIMCDGATWVSSSVIGQGQTYAASLFTTDMGILMRNLNVGSDGKVKTSTNARSTGPIGVDEYSAQGTNQTEPSETCIFTLPENGTPTRDEINYMGLMQTGQYVSTRTLDPSQTGAVTMINGTGMILVHAKSSDGTNETTHTSDVAGTMNMTEKIVFGGDE